MKWAIWILLATGVMGAVLIVVGLVVGGGEGTAPPAYTAAPTPTTSLTDTTAASPTAPSVAPNTPPTATTTTAVSTVATTAATTTTTTATTPVEDIVGLTLAAEATVAYDIDNWAGNRWPAAVNDALRWKDFGCRWAFYSAHEGWPDCLGDVHRDHFVSVAEAHRSGGWEWSAERREEFYYDLDNLFVLPAAENLEKSDHDPAGWQPTGTTACVYAYRWIVIKQKWELTADQDELDALAWTLEWCDPIYYPSGRRAGRYAGYEDLVTMETAAPPPASTTPAPTVTTADPAGDLIGGFHRYRAMPCGQWIDETVRLHGLTGETLTEGEAVGLLRWIVRKSAERSYDWEHRDPDGDRYPCETQLGAGYPLGE